MFERALMVLGLRRQQCLLDELIREMERRSLGDVEEIGIYGQRTKQVAKNLKQLRKIKNDYFWHWQSQAEFQ